MGHLNLTATRLWDTWDTFSYNFKKINNIHVYIEKKKKSEKVSRYPNRLRE